VKDAIRVKKVSEQAETSPALVVKEIENAVSEEFRKQTGFHLTGMSTEYSSKPSGVSAAKDLTLLDHNQRPNRVSYSAMKKTSLADGESISKNL